KYSRTFVMLVLLSAFLTVQGGAKTDPAKPRPPGLDYDTPPKARKVILPVYPYELLTEGVKGSVKAIFAISPEGKVAELVIVQASHPEFGLAFAAAAELATFEPALKEGKPVVAVLRHEHAFSPNSKSVLTK